MTQIITQYRVFIGAPGGLEDERRRVRRKLEQFSIQHGARQDISFIPVAWDDPIDGRGRPQPVIDAALQQCDYAVFVLPAAGSVSGIEQTLARVAKLYASMTLRNVVLLVKASDNDQALSVLNARIDPAGNYIWQQYRTLDGFDDALAECLVRWSDQHQVVPNALLLDGVLAAGNSPAAADHGTAFGFDHWVGEAVRALGEDAEDRRWAGYYAEKALEAARSDPQLAAAFYILGVVGFGRGDFDEAMVRFSTISDRFADSDDADRRVWCARALIGQGAVLSKLDRWGDAIRIYDHLLSSFATSSELALCEQVAKALIGKARALLKRSHFARAPEFATEQEIGALYDMVLTRFGATREPRIGEQVLTALLDKFRFTQAIIDADEVLQRFATASELSLRLKAAQAMRGKAMALARQHFPDAAIAACDGVVTLFGGAEAPALRAEVAEALLNKSAVLARQRYQTPEEAAAVLDDALGRLGPAADPVLQQMAARLLIRKIRSLAFPKGAEAAIGLCDAMLSRFGGTNDPILRRHGAMALAAKAAAFFRLGREAEADASYDALRTEFGATPELWCRREVAQALLERGNQLMQCGRQDAAITAYDDVVTWFGHESDPAILGPVKDALKRKADCLGTLDRGDAAIAVHDELLARLDGDGGFSERAEIVRITVDKARALRALGHGAAEIAAYDDLLDRLRTEEHRMVREAIGVALISKGAGLRALGRHEDAVAAYDDLLGRCGPANAPELGDRTVARALVEKGNTLATLGRTDAAIACYDDLLARFGALARPEMRASVAEAQARKSNLTP